MDCGKVHIFWKGHKNLRNLHSRFDWHYIGKIYSGDFATFCGLLRITELQLPVAEHSVDWLKLGWRRLLAIRSSRFVRYIFHKNMAKKMLRPAATVSEMKSMNFSLFSLKCWLKAKKSLTKPRTKFVSDSACCCFFFFSAPKSKSLPVIRK